MLVVTYREMTIYHIRVKTPLSTFTLANIFCQRDQIEETKIS